MTIIHAAATWFMVGLIWVIQVVHYPLFAGVGADGFIAYEAGHTRRMGAVLAIPASVEVVTAVALVWIEPPGIGAIAAYIGVALLAVTWLATAVVHLPIHRRLSLGYRANDIKRLVAANWFRTAAWTLRGGIASLLLI